ncbi:serine hydrolase domain-containing protein [Desulfobacter postgatei]|uniref:serine hydrolase domain-containing protein n=1 Tax=Desulfobacter postgatei TaxID=2293 RepID=UPI00259B4770|nr:serine hydrolase domain-containing protein [uncultured Desulfobacter sp.]
MMKLIKTVAAMAGFLIVFNFIGMSHAQPPGIYENPWNKGNMRRYMDKPIPSNEFFTTLIIHNVEPHVGKYGQDKSPGIAVGLVTREGDIALGFGQVNIGLPMPVDGNTIFGIGSISKLFTGLILANGVAHGELSLSDKANKWLKKDMQIDDRITLRHLVSHYSGLPNFPGNIISRKEVSWDKETAELMPAKDYTRQNLTDCIKQHVCDPDQGVPGKKYIYSNLGIGLLSIVLQNRYGFSDFETLNREKLTNVLNMKRTATNIPDFIRRNKSNMAQGYQYDGQSNRFKPVVLSDMGVLAGAGELVSCANDMNLLMGQLIGLRPGSLDMAAREAQRVLGDVEPEGTKVAYAHEIKYIRSGAEIHFKTGATPGFTGIVMWRDKPKVGLVILSNRGRFKILKPLSQKLMGTISQILIKT